MNGLSLLDTFFGTDCTNYMPRVDVIEMKDSYLMNMDLPGRSEAEVEISLKDDILTIASVENAKSEKNEEKAQEKFLLRERNNGSFKRSFTLPKDVDPASVSAAFKNGILSIKMGRKAEAQERRIQIQVA